MDIQGKTALVTGASRGIGRAIALKLAQHGVRLILLVARDQQRLTEVAAEIEAVGVQAVTLPLDLTQSAEVHIALIQAWRDHGPIHLLINCAGIAHQSPFLRTRLPQMQQEISINLLGMYIVTQLVARRMAVQGGGTIVNVSSLMGKLAAPTMATYSATKFAILGFTQALRSELSPHNIRVVSLLPSLTQTDMVKTLKPFRWVVPTTPEAVAQALVSGLKRDSSEITVGWQANLATWSHRVVPQIVENLVSLASPLYYYTANRRPYFRLKNIWATLR